MPSIKRLYFDMRIGQSILFPVLAMANFIIISYKLLDLESIVSVWVYVPVFIVSFGVLLVGVGNVFRKKQQETDFTLLYEKNPEMIRTLNAIMTGDKDMIEERLQYHRRILEKCGAK